MLGDAQRGEHREGDHDGDEAQEEPIVTWLFAGVSSAFVSEYKTLINPGHCYCYQRNEHNPENHTTRASTFLTKRNEEGLNHTVEVPLNFENSGFVSQLRG